MSHGVINLRCPACGRQFLSLPQRVETLVTCPHCAQSAAMAAFQSGAAATAAPVPLVRRTIQRPVTGPVGAPQTPAWAPPATPQQAPAAWPPAPEVAPAWQAAMAPPARTPSPFGMAAAAPPTAPMWQAPTPAPVATPFSSFGLPEVGMAPPPPPAPAVSPFAGVANPPALHLPPDQVTPMWQELPAYDYQASRRGRSIWGWLFLLVLGLGAGGWVMLDSMKPGMVAEIPVATKPESVADTPSPEGTRIPAETPTPEPAADPAMVAAGAATEEPEIRRAEVASPTVGEIDLNAANEACRGLLEKLFQSKSQDERMKCVLNGKEHEASLKQFFTTHPEGVQIVTLRMATRTAHLFPGGRQAALFQLATNANPNGGLVRLVSDGQEGFVLDWPLFEQTHEKRLAAFVEGKDERPSAWFHVGFRRSHAFDLPVGQEEKYLALDFQASADDSLRLSALMEKQSTLGRRLEEETDWGEVYLAAFLVQRVTLAEGGKARFVVVDVRRPAEDLVK